jgi:hypothetical protein
MHLLQKTTVHTFNTASQRIQQCFDILLWHNKILGLVHQKLLELSARLYLIILTASYFCKYYNHFFPSLVGVMLNKSQLLILSDLP